MVGINAGSYGFSRAAEQGFLAEIFLASNSPIFSGRSTNIQKDQRAFEKYSFTVARLIVHSFIHIVLVRAILQPDSVFYDLGKDALLVFR